MNAKKTAWLGILLALSMVVTYLETLIPLNFGIYGFRLGLANIVVMLVLKYFGIKYALAINITRAVIVNLLFGNLVSLAFSLSAGVCAVLAMRVAFMLPKVGTVGVSVIGSAVHNGVQTAVACILLSPSIIKLLPPMLIIAEVSGIFTGIVAEIFLRKTEKVKILSEK